MNSELEVAQLGWHFPPVHEVSGHSSCHTPTKPVLTPCSVNAKIRKKKKKKLDKTPVRIVAVSRDQIYALHYC